jgi:hypothetical protein
VADGSENDFYAILGRALVDPGFRERLRDDKDRTNALSDIGIELNDEQLQQLDENLDAVDNLAEQFGANRAAAT